MLKNQGTGYIIRYGAKFEISNIRDDENQLFNELKFHTYGSPPYVEVSEYLFKQNKNVFKNMAVLLYTYFYNIYLNVLRPTFFKIYNLPFLRYLNIGNY